MLEEIKHVYLRSHPLFNNLCEKRLCEARSVARVKIVQRGDVLYFVENDYSKIYLLIKENIKIRTSDRMGNEFIDIINAPDIFGDLSLEEHIHADQCAEAVSDNTIVCCFRATDFRRILEDNQLMFMHYVNMVNRKLRKMESRYSDLVYLDAKERLVRFIKTWAKANGSQHGDKIIVRNDLTHSDIAAVISTSRQSVNVLLNELKGLGVIQYDRKQFELNASFI
ncbi:Crp/Fnr family transcriptional regulator [Mucilaginibacter ginsenosidivorans]|uniref:Crp/Fnr family transcriptional regulator n=1 Tax=Mucilaginibacter ginsenosidivorans TaxID=398053 RepID=A0A5B8UYG3_9SPHI|nr:Crp/Fnr family transcriptional regulator [Mucilaginibacter ginsenosidivorans]QEC64049.1 Crp/Fnr family transcriptional regulator [Mucilaginibacter ginsenosidivorans]